jgi:hypothetical protein
MMAFTQADLDKLDQAIRDRGVARVIQFSDRSVTFDSVEDMQRLRAMMARQAAGSTSGTRYGSVDKGVW